MALRILVVEDEPDLQMMYTLILEPLGNVTACTTVDAAIAALEDETFDVIVLDLVLSDSNGIELLHRLPAMTAHPPAIVVSAAAHGPLGEEARAAGAAVVLRCLDDLELLVPAVVEVTGAGHKTPV